MVSVCKKCKKKYMFSQLYFFWTALKILAARSSFGIKWLKKLLSQSLKTAIDKKLDGECP